MPSLSMLPFIHCIPLRSFSCSMTVIICMRSLTFHPFPPVLILLIHIHHHHHYCHGFILFPIHFYMILPVTCASIHMCTCGIHPSIAQPFCDHFMVWCHVLTHYDCSPTQSNHLYPTQCVYFINFSSHLYQSIWVTSVIIIVHPISIPIPIPSISICIYTWSLIHS